MQRGAASSNRSVSRFDKNTGVDFLIHACNQLKRRLLVAGIGREEKRLKAIAGPTIVFFGRVLEADLPALYANCRALLFAANVDFAIVSVEAQSFWPSGDCLRPRRIVGDRPRGRPRRPLRHRDFFSEQTVESVVDGIYRFEARENSFVPAEIQQHARQFDTSVFIDRMRTFINKRP